MKALKRSTHVMLNKYTWVEIKLFIFSQYAMLTKKKKRKFYLGSVQAEIIFPSVWQLKKKIINYSQSPKGIA